MDLLFRRSSVFALGALMLAVLAGGSFVLGSPVASDGGGSAPGDDGADEGAERPNIILVYADDLDPSALGFMGNEIVQTPNIDRLAEQGVKFRNAFVNTAICVTSRANLMTGRYGANTGIYMDDFEELSDEQAAMLFPTRLREAGYHTGYVGKWHLGPVPEEAFDSDQTFEGQGHYWDEEHPPGESEHLTNRLGNQAVQMIQDAPAEQPFSITVGFKAPHVQDGFHPVESYQPSPSTAVLYEKDEMPVPPLSDSAFFESQPQFIRESLGRERWEYRLGPPESLNFQRSIRRYYRMVTGVDNQIGKMREALEKTGRDENTIIVVASDHGLYLGERGLAGKWFGHDTSMHIPLVVFDPRLPETERGTWRDDMVTMVDFKPTFLDWAGTPPSEGVQGESFAALVAGERPENRRSEVFYEHHSFEDRIPRSEGIRTDRYKYLRYLDSEPVFEELYDLKEDPNEENNLANDPVHSELLMKMRAKWKKRRKEIGSC